MSEARVSAVFKCLSRGPYRPPECYDPHWRMALGTVKDRSGTFDTGLNQDMQHHLDERQKLLGVAMQKAIIPDATKAFW